MNFTSDISLLRAQSKFRPVRQHLRYLECCLSCSMICLCSGLFRQQRQLALHASVSPSALIKSFILIRWGQNTQQRGVLRGFDLHILQRVCRHVLSSFINQRLLPNHRWSRGDVFSLRETYSLLTVQNAIFEAPVPAQSEMKEAGDCQFPP